MIRTQAKSPTLFEPVVCTICGSKNFTVVYPGKFPKNLSEDFLQQVYRSSSDQALFEQVVRCRRCDLVYLNPRLKPGLIIDSYAEGEDESFIAQDPMRVRTFSKAISRLVKELKLRVTRKTKLLDIGCAGGAFVEAAKEAGFGAIGIEPNKWLSNYARTKRGLDVRAGTLSDHHFPDKTFDIITLWDVIEHVPDPTKELEGIYRILKKGGHLVINYPDHVSLPAKILGRKWPFWLSVHLTYYTPVTIRKQLEKMGFEVLRIRPHWQTLELGYIFKRITPYFPIARYPKLWLERLGAAHWPITYWIGQTQVIARKNVD